MSAATLRRLLAATAAAALITAALPVMPDRFDSANPFDASSAAARNGGDDSGSGGGDDGGSGGNSGPGGGGDSGRGGGDDNGGHGGDDGGGDDNGGHGGGDGTDDNGGPGGGDDDGGREDDNDDDENAFGHPDGHYLDGATGAKIEVGGGKIEIMYPDGWKEELENGIFELKDPSGRTVIERRATREDVARLRAIVN